MKIKKDKEKWKKYALHPPKLEVPLETGKQATQLHNRITCSNKRLIPCFTGSARVHQTKDLEVVKELHKDKRNQKHA